MRTALFAVAGVLLVLTLGVYGYRFFSGSGLRSPEELANVAVTSSDAAVREQAALDLARSGPEARPHLLRVIEQSKVPEVKAAAVQGLAALRDFESMPKLIELLDDPAEKVRASAGSAVAHILGADYFFQAADPPEKRAQAVQTIKRAYEKMKQSPPPMYRRS